MVQFVLGVVTSFLGQLLYGVCMALIRGSKYQSVAGTWKFKDDVDGRAVGEARITQWGDRVTAKVIRSISRAGNEMRREFTYKGRIYANQLLLTFHQKSGGDLIVGNLVLSFSGDLKLLQGYTTYFDQDQGAVVSHEIHFARI